MIPATFEAARGRTASPAFPGRFRTLQGGFTLVELLVVVAILSLLAALLFPVYASARHAAYKATALSNARQLSAANDLYSNDDDDFFAPYFSGFDPDTKIYSGPQRYWPQLVSVYIMPIVGHGALDEALADDLPKIFFDPIKPFKSQRAFPFQYGIVASWGVSDDIVDWFAPVGVLPTKRPASRSAVASSSECVHLVETYDWLLGSGFPGNAISLSPFDENGTGANLSVDAPYGARYAKRSLSSSADPNGLNIVVFCDGHAAATRVGLLTGSGRYWSVTGTGAWR